MDNPTRGHKHYNETYGANSSKTGRALWLACYSETAVYNWTLCGPWDPLEYNATNLQVVVNAGDTTPPEISNIQAIPSIQNIGDYVNISASVVDSVEVDEVYLYILYPDSTVENFSITQNKTGDTYYCNKTYKQTDTKLRQRIKVELEWKI